MTDEIGCSLSQATTCNDQQWSELYIWLLPLALGWVWNADVPLWQGQQQDIAEEIAQEAVLRTFHYHQRAEKGEVRPIATLKPFSRTIAHNYFRDLRRKDRRVTRLSSPSLQGTTTTKSGSLVDPSQIAIEHLILQSVLITAARAIPKLPPRQRQALLKDLAGAAVFDEHPEVLEQALAENGIQLCDYYKRSSCSPVERKQDAALRYLAYKRLKKEMKI